MEWRTVVKVPGEEADAYLNQLTEERWMIKSLTWVPNGERIYLGIVACQSPEYAKKAKGKK